MHFVFAWECEEATPERAAFLEQSFEAALAQVSFVRIFARVYAVNVMGNGVYEVLQAQLATFAKAQPETVKFVMSPLTSRGRFHGRMSAEAVEGLERIIVQQGPSSPAAESDA